MKKKIKCKQCEKVFECYYYSWSYRKFCSKDCYYEYCKRKKIGYWNPEVGRINGIKGGIAVHKKYPEMFKKIGKKLGDNYGKQNGILGAISLRKHKNFIYKNINFDSYAEMQCAKLLLIYKLIDKLIENVNCHVKFGNFEVDFILDNGNILEYHPCNNLYESLTYKQFLKKRKKQLKAFTNAKVIVVEKLKDIEILK